MKNGACIWFYNVLWVMGILSREIDLNNRDLTGLNMKNGM